MGASGALRESVALTTVLHIYVLKGGAVHEFKTNGPGAFSSGATLLSEAKLDSASQRNPPKREEEKTLAARA